MEARGVVSGASAIVGVGNVAVNADIVGPSHRLLEAMLRPAWPQEKADFLQVLREGKALYDELHGIFGLETIERYGDNRAGDRADFREQVEANRDLMASTAEVMEAGLAQEAPDGRTIRMGEKAFRVLREGAKAMGKLFAEGYFRELGREAATRVRRCWRRFRKRCIICISSWQVGSISVRFDTHPLTSMSQLRSVALLTREGRRNIGLATSVPACGGETPELRQDAAAEQPWHRPGRRSCGRPSAPGYTPAVTGAVSPSPAPRVRAPRPSFPHRGCRPRHCWSVHHRRNGSVARPAPAPTLAATAALGSPGGARDSSAAEAGWTSTVRSMRSNIGPLIRF